MLQDLGSYIAICNQQRKYKNIRLHKDMRRYSPRAQKEYRRSLQIQNTDRTATNGAILSEGINLRIK